MASSDNLAGLEPWISRHPFADPWISDSFALDTETLTRALYKSDPYAFFPLPSLDFFSPFDPLPAPTVSDQDVAAAAVAVEAAAPKRRGALAVSSGKATKRKSRASKRTHTTFIAADAANFRHMVQQVTGVRFGEGDGQLPVNTVILKPEPQRAPHRQVLGCLPTLDTSACLLDQQLEEAPIAVSADTGPSSPSLSLTAEAEAEAAPHVGSALDFGGFGCFPTLESWRVM